MKIRQIVGLMCIVVLAASLTSLAHAEWKWSGYTQVRLNAWDSNYGNTKPSSDFLIRRARIKLEGVIDPDTTITLQADLANLVNDETTSGPGNIELKDALITRKLTPQWFTTLGYTSVPYGYEVPTSDAVQWPLERSQAANKFFPDQRDTGLYFHLRPIKTSGAQVDFGYGNGLHNWYQVSNGNRDNDSRAAIGRVQWPLKNGGVAGVSYMWADRNRGPAGGATTDFPGQNVLGAHVRYVFDPHWTLQGEYYDGNYLNNLTSKDATGWYGLAGYTFCPKPITLFYRYDTLDSGDCNNFNRSVLGVVYDQTKCQRYTLQFEDITNDGSGVGHLNVAAQWQVKY